MSPDTAAVVEASFEALRLHHENLVAVFYRRLFEDHPSVRPLFREEMAPQQAALLGALTLAVGNIRNPSALLPVLHDLGRRHVAYGVVEAHYPIVHDVMLDAMAEVAGAGWTPTLHAAWSETLMLVATTMMEGAAAPLDD